MTVSIEVASSEQVPTNPKNFYQFLMEYRSPHALGDSVSDLASDVRVDADAPRENTQLLAYLRRRVPCYVVDEALRLWREENK